MGIRLLSLLTRKMVMQKKKIPRTLDIILVLSVRGYKDQCGTE